MTTYDASKLKVGHTAHYLGLTLQAGDVLVWDESIEDLSYSMPAGLDEPECAYMEKILRQRGLRAMSQDVGLVIVRANDKNPQI